MNKNDMVEFAKIMATAGVVFDKEISKELCATYFDVFTDYDLDSIKKAFTQYIKTNKFFPKPAEIIELINPSINIKDRAEAAWLQLLEGIRKHGYYDSVEFEDKVIHSCIRAMGGWSKVSDREQDTWMHKDFINFYESFEGKPYHEDRIIGAIESRGGKHSFGKVGNFLKDRIKLTE